MELFHIEHMWCRWCGGFGITDQMVCADSACLTQDMTQGALAGVSISGDKDAQIVLIKTQATAHYGVMMNAIHDNTFAKGNTFAKITAT